ncbi:MAG: NAD+ synthase [Bacteroidota bacterium]
MSLRIALAQLNYHIGNFEGNLAKILAHIDKARAAGADIVCFGEFAICGYPPRDFLEFSDFMRRCEESMEVICEASSGIAVAIGAPTINPVPEGKDLFNSAYFMADQKVLHIQHKGLLPTYDIFDDYRYFEPATEYNVVEFKGHRIALSVCEDIWNLPYRREGINAEELELSNDNPLYTFCPLDRMMDQHPDLILNLSASPFNYDHAEHRLGIVKANVLRYGIPMFYVNHVGAQTEVIFDGGSIAMSPNGIIFDEMVYFKEDMQIYELADVIAGSQSKEQPKDKTLEIHDALVLGLSDYFGKLGFSKCILGLSGGIDSAVTTVIATRALGADNVRVLLMPSEFSSDHSVTDSIELANNLGIQYDIINIQDIYQQYLTTLAPLFENRPFNIAEENLQARARGMLLMAMSNKFGNIVLNTSNKSEAAVGYGTLYGDMCGGLSVLGDVYKTEVYQLARYINKDHEVIPEHIITKPPSAELRPDQKDSDSLPDYDMLDTILFQYIEKRKGPQEIIDMGYEEKLVRRILRLVNINEFKRYQTAPALRVSAKAFGQGRRMPIVGKYLN